MARCVLPVPTPPIRTTLARCSTKSHVKSSSTSSRSRPCGAAKSKPSSVFSTGKRASLSRRWMRRSRRWVTSKEATSARKSACACRLVRAVRAKRSHSRARLVRHSVLRSPTRCGGSGIFGRRPSQASSPSSRPIVGREVRLRDRHRPEIVALDADRRDLARRLLAAQEQAHALVARRGGGQRRAHGLLDLLERVVLHQPQHPDPLAVGLARLGAQRRAQLREGLRQYPGAQRGPPPGRRGA